MKDAELDAIEANWKWVPRYRPLSLADIKHYASAGGNMANDLDVLVAEVRRLRDTLREVRVGPGYDRPLRDRERPCRLGCHCNKCRRPR